MLYKMYFCYCSGAGAARGTHSGSPSASRELLEGWGCVSCSESITSTHRTVQEGWTQQVSFLLTKGEAEPQSGLTC